MFLFQAIFKAEDFTHVEHEITAQPYFYFFLISLFIPKVVQIWCQSNFLFNPVSSSIFIFGSKQRKTLM